VTARRLEKDLLVVRSAGYQADGSGEKKEKMIDLSESAPANALKKKKKASQALTDINIIRSDKGSERRISQRQDTDPSFIKIKGIRRH